MLSAGDRYTALPLLTLGLGVKWLPYPHPPIHSEIRDEYLMFHLGKKTGFPRLKRSCLRCTEAASSLQASDKISAYYPGSHPLVCTAGEGGPLQVAGLLS